MIVPRDMEGTNERWIRVDHPIYAISQVLRAWFWELPVFEGIHDTAIVHPSAVVDPSAGIGAWVTIGENAEISAGVSIYERCSVGRNSRLGAGTFLYPNVTIYDDVTIGERGIVHAGVVIGGDGFGFATWEGTHHKVPQIGGVRIGDDVEIGANSTIDRGTLGNTVIGDGTKLDNMVMVGHNVEIGKHCFLAAQTGIAGSTTIGDYCAFGGQSGAVGHLKIGNQVQVAAQSALTKNTDGPVTVSGKPSRPVKEQLRKEALLARLPKLVERVKLLEKDRTNDD